MTDHFAWLIILSGALASCAGDGGRYEPISGPQALVITSDYQTGSYSTISLADQSVVRDIAPLHPDVVCRTDQERGIPYIISRLGADTVRVLDPLNDYQAAAEYSVGPGSNAQDLAVVSAERAYVLRFSQPELLVIEPSQGQELGRVDLSPWADEDGVPEASWAVVHQDKVYLALQRVDNFQPTDYSSILVMDAESGAVEREIRLSASNPFARLRYSPSLDRLVVGTMGQVFELDGGVELIDPATGDSSGLVVDEQTLGGDITDALVVNENKGYAVVGVTQPDFSQITSIISFDPASGQKLGVLAEAQGFEHSFMELSPDGSQLWITQRTRTAPGIRIFSTADDSELTERPIDVGLPPFMICFVP